MKTILTKTIITCITFISCTMFITSCKKDVHITPKADKISPDSAAGNTLLTITGSGLRNVQSAVFDLGNVPVAFNPNFNTDNAILIRVPVTANVGPQHIVFTTTEGYQFSLPFIVLAVPSITSAFPIDFQAGSTVTIKGNYLQSAYHVQLLNTQDTATIVSATSTQLVLKMPASAAPSAKLVVYNSAGSSNSDFSLINMDKQFKFFTEGYGTGIQDWSWCGTSVSNDANFAVASTQSLKEVYAKGGYQGTSFHSDNNIVVSDYTALTFYVKGGSEDNKLDIAPDPQGTAKKVVVNVPANVWTYITIPVVGNYDGITTQRFDFQIEGNSNADQTLYYDDVLLVH